MSSGYNFPIVNLGASDLNVGGAFFGARPIPPGQDRADPDSPAIQVPAIIFGSFGVGELEDQNSQVQAALLIPDVEVLDKFMQTLMTVRRKMFPQG